MAFSTGSKSYPGRLVRAAAYLCSRANRALSSGRRFRHLLHPAQFSVPVTVQVNSRLRTLHPPSVEIDRNTHNLRLITGENFEGRSYSRHAREEVEHCERELQNPQLRVKCFFPLLQHV